MNALSQNSRELYGLFHDSGANEQFDERFCRALATALEAVEVSIHQFDEREGQLATRCSFSAGAGAGPRRISSPGDAVAPMASTTGDVASHFECNPSSHADGAAGTLQFAVPVTEAGDSLVIEVVKRQSSPRPDEDDVFLVETFGSLLAYRGLAQSRGGVGGGAVGAQGMEAIGKSSAFTRAQLAAIKAARAECPVLILGETGTGKELVARQLHDASWRHGKPYIAINCGALAETLLESEFFGHVKGAFTGAQKRRGKLEEADGGTVFLDEIGEMSPTCQTKLLRTLDSGEITPLGGNKPIKINVRFIAATHRNLELMIQEGKFREDLFYRLQGMRIELPPLRRRRGDVELLAKFFFEQEARLQGSKACDFSPEAMERLGAHAWPGNIRELKQVVASAVAMADGEWIMPGDLPHWVLEPPAAAVQACSAPPPPPPPPVAPVTPLPGPANEERNRIIAALAATAYPGTGRWNLRAAARQLDMHHQTLAYRVRKVYRITHD